MNLLTNSSPVALWYEVVKEAESQNAISLGLELENYLVSLLVKYTNKPEIANKIFAKAFLEALKMQQNQRQISLQHVGDQCLIFAGLFPKRVEKLSVKLNYFIDLGRSAYASVSEQTNDLFDSLAMQFVLLMDVLQSIRYSTLTPLEAYEQWTELGSRRALSILKTYTKSQPFKKC